MIKRFLYLKIFLAVTLLVNFIRFHKKVTLSINTLLPLGGVFGRIISAGTLRIERRLDMTVTSKTSDTDVVTDIRLIVTGIGVSIGGISYICKYAPYMIRGNRLLPTNTPSHPPMALALIAYTRNLKMMLGVL